MASMFFYTRVLNTGPIHHNPAMPQDAQFKAVLLFIVMFTGHVHLRHAGSVCIAGQ